MAERPDRLCNPIVEIASAHGVIRMGNHLPIVFILGPCVLESREHGLAMSRRIGDIARNLHAPVIYKTSYDKANRTSSGAFRGLEFSEALNILAEIRQTSGLPLLTDVHLPDQCAQVAEVADILQIPAFLCRQTDLLQAAAATGRIVNVKKGQFLAPWDMQNVVAKLAQSGARDILVTERGVSFGYNTLVTDFRALPILSAIGAPVVFDATHSVQQPGGMGQSSGGQREFVPHLARAAAAIGVAAIFMETHDDPARAPSDGPNMVPISHLEALMSQIMEFDRLAKSRDMIVFDG